MTSPTPIRLTAAPKTAETGGIAQPQRAQGDAAGYIDAAPGWQSPVLQ